RPVGRVLGDAAGQVVAGVDERLAQDLVAGLDDAHGAAVVPPGVLRPVQEVLREHHPPAATGGQQVRGQLVVEGQVEQLGPDRVEVGGSGGGERVVGRGGAVPVAQQLLRLGVEAVV